MRTNSGHLTGLATKIAARHEKRRKAKPGAGPANGLRLKAPANPVRSTRASRQADHKRRMTVRRQRQIDRRPNA